MKQKRISKLLIIISIVFSLNSCEYKLTEEYFRDLAKPANSHSFELNLKSTQDTIFIYDVVNLAYEFDLNKLKVEFQKENL